MAMLDLVRIFIYCTYVGTCLSSSDPSDGKPSPYAHIFPSVFNIGGVLSTDKNGQYLLDAIQQANEAQSPERILPDGVQLNGTYILMDVNPIRAAQSICEVLIPSQVYVVIASRATSQSDLSPMAVSFTCGFYKIPVIGLSARESSFSDKVCLSLWSIYVRAYGSRRDSYSIHVDCSWQYWHVW